MTPTRVARAGVVALALSAFNAPASPRARRRAWPAYADGVASTTTTFDGIGAGHHVFTNAPPAYPDPACARCSMSERRR
jgi:hypothetical protein